MIHNEPKADDEWNTELTSQKLDPKDTPEKATPDEP